MSVGSFQNSAESEQRACMPDEQKITRWRQGMLRVRSYPQPTLRVPSGHLPSAYPQPTLSLLSDTLRVPTLSLPAQPALRVCSCATAWCAAPWATTARSLKTCPSPDHANPMRQCAGCCARDDVFAAGVCAQALGARRERLGSRHALGRCARYCLFRSGSAVSS